MTALVFFYRLINDWSITIVLLTILIRVVLVPLDIKQRKSSMKMASIAPEVESIKKRYANDQQLVQKKTQELYKQRGVSPMAGCLPMLIQLPLLFAFFGAMRVIASGETIAFLLNTAQQGAAATPLPQWLWVHNFWQPDSGLATILPNAQGLLDFIKMNMSYLSPQSLVMLQQQGLISFSSGMLQINAANYDSLVNSVLAANNLTGYMNGWFGLPLIAGVSLFFQQKFMSKQTQAGGQPQPGGKFMLWFFPLFSIYICATSNTAFSIYWVMTNVYSIALTLIINQYYKWQKSKLPATK